MSAMLSRLLIVYDDPDMREALFGLFSTQGHACELAADAITALKLIDRQTFDAVVSDVRMDGMDGLELLDRVKLSHPALPVVVITAASSIPQAVSAIQRGASGYAVKPCDGEELQRIVASAIDAQRQTSGSVRPGPAPTSTGGRDLIGTGPAMRSLQTA